MPAAFMPLANLPAATRPDTTRPETALPDTARPDTAAGAASEAADFAPGRPAADVDRSLRLAVAAVDRAQRCAVLWFAEVQRRGLHRELGHATLHLYATIGLGFSDNRYWQFKRLADDLDRLPALQAAVANGEIGWTKAQQVARVAAADTQAAWIAKARSTGRRELEREVRAARERRHPRREAGPELALGTAMVDTAANGAAATAALAATLETTPVASPAPMPAAALAGAPSHSLALRADALRLARLECLIEQARKRRLVPAGADRVEVLLHALAALVEGNDHAGGPGAGEERPTAPRVTTPRLCAPAAQVIVHQCPNCRAATVTTPRGELPLTAADTERLACEARRRQPGGRNSAAVPPRVRTAVLARDRHRCATPGCGTTRFLEVHHIVPRRAGGANLVANLVTLCGRCHAFAHEHAAGSRLPFAGGALAPAQGAAGTDAGAVEAGMVGKVAAVADVAKVAEVAEAIGVATATMPAAPATPAAPTAPTAPTKRT